MEGIAVVGLRDLGVWEYGEPPERCIVRREEESLGLLDTTKAGARVRKRFLPNCGAGSTALPDGTEECALLPTSVP